MMKVSIGLFVLAAVVLMVDAKCDNPDDHPFIGMSAELNTRAHGVSGTVTIIDGCTLEITNFFYDGSAIDVRVWGAKDSVWGEGYSMSEDLVRGEPYEGDEVIFGTLPDGMTWDDINSFSIWCVPAGADFGSVDAADFGEATGITCELNKPKRVQAYHDDVGLQIKWSRNGNDKEAVCYDIKAKIFPDGKAKKLVLCTSKRKATIEKADIYTALGIDSDEYMSQSFEVSVRAKFQEACGETKKTPWKGKDRSYYFAPCNRPEGKVGVTLSYDDTMDTQIDVALPALKAHGFKATYYVMDIYDRPNFHNLVELGHELGSHTLQHPCPLADWTEPNDASEDYTLERMSDELDATIDMLKTFGAPEPLTFAYPCGVTWVGEAQESYIPLVKEKFQFARGVACADAGPDSPQQDVEACFYTDLNGGAGPTITRLQNASPGSWVVLGFHGIGGEWLSISTEDHEEILQYLTDNSDKFYVDTFKNIAQCYWKK